ncbi:MAG TPA: mannitol dehydrogenase family protein [Thermomicrobiales bacterium]|jgi:fructuronate reductase/mannitol 2-dehydrogenase
MSTETSERSTPQFDEASARPLTVLTLPEHAERVAVPTYDRAALIPAIVHLGVGSFHRAHQAVYLDDLARRGVMEWGECGVGLRRPDMHDALAPQDNLYTVIERGADGDSAHVIGAMQRYLHAPQDPAAVLDTLADPRTRVVTLTITMPSYDIDPVTGDFQADTPEVQADLDRADGAAPVSVFGYLCDALARRRDAGIAPFTILSCDNMQDNGGATRTAVVSYAQRCDEGLADWIAEHVAFPSSMVDRITPETTPEHRALLAEQFGIADRWPVVTEPFRQWIIEDTFSNGRPPLEQVGVQFVADVGPYMTMKTRLLNASHCALGYLGILAGYGRTDEAMGDPLIREFIARVMDEEVTPLLPDVPGIELDAYKRTLLERFANPQIGDNLSRLAARGSTKMPTFVLPSIKEAIEAGRPHTLLDLAVAAWFRYLQGVDDDGKAIEVVDPLADRLQELAPRGEEDPRQLLHEQQIFDSLGHDDDFAAAVERAARMIGQRGGRQTLDAYLHTEAAGANAAD